ncbi:MAG: Uma2 family endonuclease [Chloroflexi bacterium]|nr:Uma2 family endonuclease [Chloroflexota bacterium]
MARVAAFFQQVVKPCAFQVRVSTGVKPEYVLGQIYALVGESEDHNRIALSIATTLLLATARRGSCRIVGSHQRLQAGESPYSYPDIQVLRDPTEDDPSLSEARWSGLLSCCSTSCR